MPTNAAKINYFFHYRMELFVTENNSIIDKIDKYIEDSMAKKLLLNN